MIELNYWLKTQYNRSGAHQQARISTLRVDRSNPADAQYKRHAKAAASALWRASQLAQSVVRRFDTGHPSLLTQLPRGGWPTGSQIDLRATTW